MAIKAALTAANFPACGVRPSDPSWPTAASRDKLNGQAGGQRIAVSSPLAPCTDGTGGADCEARIEAMRNPYFIGAQAGGTPTSGRLDAWTSAPRACAVAVRQTAHAGACVSEGNFLTTAGKRRSGGRTTRGCGRSKRNMTRRACSSFTTGWAAKKGVLMALPGRRDAPGGWLI